MDNEKLLASLSFEQQFAVAAFKEECSKFSREESLELLAVLYQNLLVQANTYKRSIAKQWGMEGLDQQQPTETKNDNGQY